jgi:uracil-DNA glycosylase family 4
MSLQLDARQRAMLAAMGVRVFEPLHAEVSETLTTPVASVAEPLLAPVSEPLPVQEPKLAPTGTLDWQPLAQAVANGHACSACPAGGHGVFGTGDSHAEWLIVGEPPDENEEAAGEPFVGDAGKLLDNMLKALGLDRRSKVFLTNVIKCRRPGSRNPAADELAHCEAVLRRQVQLLQPRVILAMGRFAMQALLGTGEPIGKLRGRAHQYLGVPVVVTYHPALLLRNPADKAKAWSDLCLAQALVLAGPA